MMTNWVKTPWWLKAIFPSKLIWSMPVDDQPAVYITFDDGPHHFATPFALQQLKEYNAKATFFFVGNNVSKHPDIYQNTIADGHTVGNHTNDHRNGWKTPNSDYLQNIQIAEEVIDSHIFRPPYGRIKWSQARMLWRQQVPWRIYMWDVLSADFDRRLTGEQCVKNVLDHIKPGSIVVFHDSEKAWPRMSFALPRVLDHCRRMKWQVAALPKY